MSAHVVNPAIEPIREALYDLIIRGLGLDQTGRVRFGQSDKTSRETWRVVSGILQLDFIPREKLESVVHAGLSNCGWTMHEQALALHCGCPDHVDSPHALAYALTHDGRTRVWADIIRYDDEPEPVFLGRAEGLLEAVIQQLVDGPPAMTVAPAFPVRCEGCD